MKEIKHVAMYLRISQEKKSKGKNVETAETLENHRKILTDFATQNNWTWEEFGEVLSGGASDLEQRPELQRLLNNIERFDAILVIEISRLSRNGYISEVVLKYCQDFDKPVITPHFTYDLANNNNDVLTYRFGALIASQEHALIGKRSKANKIIMAKEGKHVSGGVPYGYRRNSVTKKLEIYEPEAEVVRLIFKLHSEGLGSRKIVDLLNSEGHIPQRSKAWNHPSVKRIIRNPTYKGLIFFHDRKKKKIFVRDEKGQVVKDANGKPLEKTYFEIVETVEVEGTHEAIIDPVEWEEANLEREQRSKRYGKLRLREKPSAQYETILKDVLFCGKCGRKMTYRREKNNKISIKPCNFLLPNSAEKCDNCGILAEYVEEEIMKKLEQYRLELHVEIMKLQSLDMTDFQQDLQEKLKKNELELKAVNQQQTNLIDLAVKGIFTMEQLKDKKQELEHQMKVLEDERDEMEAQLSNIDPTSIIQQLNRMSEKLERFKILPVQQQNAVLKQIIKKIRYWRDIPEDLRKKSTRNPERRNYPFEIEIEYF